MPEPGTTGDPQPTPLVAAEKHGSGDRASITYELSETESEYWASGLGKALEEFRTQLASQLAEAYAMPVESCLALVQVPALRVAGTNIMNALTVPTQPPTILVNHGFLVFVYEVTRIVASRIDPPPETADTVSRSQLADAIALLVKITRMAYPDTSAVRRELRLTDQQKRIATSLAVCAERFVLAHETIHCNYHVPEVSAFDLFRSELPENHESQADILGAKLLIETLSRTRPDVHPAEIYAGIEIFFHALSLYEASGALVALGDHPSASQRLQDLRDTLTVNNGAEFMRRLCAYSRPIDAMLGDWRPLILQRLQA